MPGTGLSGSGLQKDSLMIKKKAEINKVVFVLSLIAIAALFLPGFIYFKKQRIMISTSLTAQQCLCEHFYIILTLTILVTVLICLKHKSMPYLTEALIGFTFVLLLFDISSALGWLPLDKTEYSRLSFGPAMWLWIFCMAGIIIKITEKADKKWLISLLLFLPLSIVIILAVTGKLNGLAIMMEYHSKQNMYWDNISKHIMISLGVMIASVIIGIPLGYLVSKSTGAEKAIFGVINITETIPGISFIAIMMIPFAYLSSHFPQLRAFGIKAFGPGPACVALTFYGVFPIIHNTRAAFKLISAEYTEIAASMGMTNRQIFFKILIPMAFPTILNGIRIALVYTISGVTLASFIGGGGLGYYMLQTDSIDTVLLGVIPVVLMTFIADKGLRFVSSILPFRGLKIND